MAGELPAKRSLRDIERRFGDWGPGYLVDHGEAFFGSVLLRPGDEFTNHSHERHTESFLVLRGTAELWLDRSQLVELGPGDFIGCPPGVEHFFRNTGEEPFEAFFAKAPGVSGDKIDAPWTPPADA